MFSNKVVIVTGSNSGIGKAAAIQFAKEGANVVIHGLNEERLQKTFIELSKISSKDKVLAINGPIQDEKTWHKLVNGTVAKFGKIDVLINNAGARNGADEDPNSMENIQYCLDVNLKAVIGLTRAAFPHLKKTKGNVVNVSTGLAIKICPAFSAYAISKAALDHYTRHAAFEYSPDDIRVNVVAPGVTDTEFHGRGGNNEEYLAALSSSIPLKRMATADEISNVILFVASEKASYVTGETYSVAGGLMAKP